MTTWLAIREHYRRTMEHAHRTQTAIAEGAELRQNVISRMLTNDREGPRVETFVRAVEGGLGIPLAQFFDSLAAGSRRDRQPLPPLSLRDQRALELGRAMLRAMATLQDRHRRA